MSALLAHLERQLQSSRRLLEIVLRQNAAIRRQDVEAVLASLADVQAEMAHRARLETERETILRTAAVERGVETGAIDLDALLVDAPGAEARQARALSSELFGLVTEVGRVHEQNRVLLRQELTFLDHLMRVLSGTPQGGYSPVGMVATSAAVATVDARA
jgi:hypothetical protein